jgi:hypothetical protein
VGRALEMLALVVQNMLFFGVEEDAALLVARKGILFPGIPEPANDIGEFLGAFVSLGMDIMLVAAEIMRLVFARRGDEIPACPAAADMVQRGELARDMIGLVVGRRSRGNETDIAGHGGQRRQQGDRLELRDVAGCRAAQRVDIRAARADAVSHEDQVEFRRFGDLRQPDIMREIGSGIGLRFRMAPRSDMVAGGIEKSSELELAFLIGHGIPASRPAKGNSWK